MMAHQMSSLRQLHFHQLPVQRMTNDVKSKSMQDNTNGPVGLGLPGVAK